MSVCEEIEQRLRSEFSPFYLTVEDESHMHNVPEGAESHFKVTLVSDRFAEQPLLKRHRAVNAALDNQLGGRIHALALHTMTPVEWYEKGGHGPDSPPCLGGSNVVPGDG